MLHKKLLFTKLCYIMSLGLFFDDKMRCRLGKKFFRTNFPFFTPLAVNDFQWIHSETINHFTREVLSRESTSFENLLFLASMCWTFGYWSCFLFYSHNNNHVYVTIRHNASLKCYTSNAEFLDYDQLEKINRSPRYTYGMWVSRSEFYKWSICQMAVNDCIVIHLYFID